jgi:hypothetical protein
VASNNRHQDRLLLLCMSTHEEAHHTIRRGNNKDEPMLTIGPCQDDHQQNENEDSTSVQETPPSLSLSSCSKW